MIDRTSEEHKSKPDRASPKVETSQGDQPREDREVPADETKTFFLWEEELQHRQRGRLELTLMCPTSTLELLLLYYVQGLD